MAILQLLIQAFSSPAIYKYKIGHGSIPLELSILTSGMGRGTMPNVLAGKSYRF
jgi:hypothetical protein